MDFRREFKPAGVAPRGKLSLRAYLESGDTDEPLRWLRDLLASTAAK